MADITNHPSRNQATGRELPKYRCHKIVWALKIHAIEYLGSSDAPERVIITPAELGYTSFEVSLDYVRKHNPQPGGYYVVYRDGYTSWSPASEFEDGYTLEKGE